MQRQVIGTVGQAGYTNKKQEGNLLVYWQVSARFFQ